MVLSRLKKKEQRFANKLKKKDSAAYARYMEQTVSYDSIKTLSSVDSIDENSPVAKKKNGKIDSLKKIQQFATQGATNAGIDSKELNQLQGQLNYRNHINDLISKRTSFLKNLVGNAGGIAGWKGIEKQVFYVKSRMKVFKEMNDEPTIAEDKALEYLQGTDSFSESMKEGGASATGSNAMGAMDAGQLEQMGYQTKALMQKSLQEKFGGNLSGVSSKMGDQLKAWQDKQKELDKLKQTKRSISGLKNTEKPLFKVNSMRGLPFCKRIEKQYSWQTQRANETSPALFTASGALGFKHTPRLTYGIGVTASLGLGQNWQHVRFSFEGVGFKTVATWEWQYGLGAYAGYERLYKRAAFTADNNALANDMYPTPHNSTKYAESMLIGLNKTYNINTKYKGAIQLLYDVWWQQKNLRSPIVLRFVTTKK